MLSFDTNILICAADREAGTRHKAAVKLLEAAQSAEAALNEQSLIEFLYVATRKRKQTLSDTERLIRVWLKNFALITAPESVIEDTLALLSSFVLSVWDARMLAICTACNCDVLFSEDMTDRMFYGKIQVINPFNPQNAHIMAELFQI